MRKTQAEKSDQNVSNQIEQMVTEQNENANNRIEQIKRKQQEVVSNQIDIYMTHLKASLKYHINNLPTP